MRELLPDHLDPANVLSIDTDSHDSEDALIIYDIHMSKPTPFPSPGACTTLPPSQSPPKQWTEWEPWNLRHTSQFVVNPIHSVFNCTD